MSEKIIQISIPEKSVKVQYKAEEQNVSIELDALRNRCLGTISAPVIIGTIDGLISVPACFFANYEVKITVK